MTYRVYFEVFDKKMRVDVDADSAVQAKEIIKDRVVRELIRDKIIFHKIVPQASDSDVVDFLRGTFNMD